MGLIYANSNYENQGYLFDAAFDCDIGDTNDFEVTMPLTDYSVLSAGALVFDADAPEFGGKITTAKISTAKNSLVWYGLTWRGMLSTKIIEPPAGQAYRSITGSAAQIMSEVLVLGELDDLYAVVSNAASSQITWKFDRYTTVLRGFEKLLATVGCRLTVKYDSDSKRIICAAEPIVDYSNTQTCVSVNVDFDVQKSFLPVNHLICLGQGELTERTVVHLYLTAEGTIAESGQYLTGENEITGIYENTGAESAAILKAEGIKRFKELLAAKLSINISDNANYGIGDIVGGKETQSGIFVSAVIKSKLLQVSGNERKISYET